MSHATTSGSSSATSEGAGSGGEGGEAISLVTPEGWAPADAEEDPFVDERPSTVECDVGWGAEDGVFEVNTDTCNHGAFTQASLADVAAGDTLELLLVHDALIPDGEEAAEAHIALAIGDEVQWSEVLMIPRGAGLQRPSWTATADHPVGAPVHFHVHNHGANSYRLVDVTRTRAAE